MYFLDVQTISISQFFCCQFFLSNQMANPQFMLSLIPVFRRSDHIIGKTLATKSFDSQSCKNYQVSNSLFVYFKAKIHYYCREQYYCHMEEAAEEGLKKFSNDSVLKFYRAYAQILQGKI